MTEPGLGDAMAKQGIGDAMVKQGILGSVAGRYWGDALSKGIDARHIAEVYGRSPAMDKAVEAKHRPSESRNPLQDEAIRKHPLWKRYVSIDTHLFRWRELRETIFYLIAHGHECNSEMNFTVRIKSGTYMVTGDDMFKAWRKLPNSSQDFLRMASKNQHLFYD